MADGGADEFLGAGIYSIPHAARLARVPARTVRRWILGYQYRYGEHLQSSAPVIKGHNIQDEDELVLTFRDLLEVMFVHSFRRHGVSWTTLRVASDKASELVGDDHPFSTLRFRTDGQSVFADIAEMTGKKSLLDLVKNQYALRSVMLHGLLEKLDFEIAADRKLPLRWWPAGKRKSVVVDPTRRFGEPIVAVEGVPTRVLALAAEGGESPERIARWYETSVKAVRHAIDFEKSFAA
jgi:uncharacterized protein (DUF433 family)